MSKLPMENRPIRMVPELATAVENLLAPLSGKKLEAAQKAVLKLYRAGGFLPFGDLVESYRQAIDDATRERVTA